MREVPFLLTKNSSTDFFTDYGPNESFHDPYEQITGGESVYLSSVRFKVQKPVEDTDRERINYRNLDTPKELIRDGSCRNTDVEFSGLGNYQAKIRKRKVELAKSICDLCIVKDVCLEFGEKTVTVDTDRYLIYGGKTAKEILEQQ